MTTHHEMTKTTPKEFVSALLGGLFAPLLAIALIAGLVLSIQARHAGGTPAAEDQAARDRIRPVGISVAVDPNAPHIDLTGEQVYNNVCTNCHGSGALGSPKFKDKGLWGPRIAKGWNVLLDHALNGFNKMPARGGESELTDLEVARGIAYMANAAGGNFEPVLVKEPEPSAAQLARGKAVYATDCASCHDTGITGAQKLDDTKAWTELIKKGKTKYLYGAAINGTFGGPAKGGNDKLSDEDTRAAVDYMVNTAQAAIAAEKARPAKAAAAK